MDLKSERVERIHHRHIPKNKFRWLRDPNLRKARAGLRELLYLLFKDEQKRLQDEWNRYWALEKQGKISHESALRHMHKLSHQIEYLNIAKNRYPVRCAGCGAFAEDMTFEDSYGSYFCVSCHRGGYGYYYRVENLD
ncbi:MAG: hypothetical protein ACQERB_10705 [Promethearchaeati archaeon]